ncbi:MAG: TlpA disulfide reductase family protein [Candidatus Omnitrophica bacterium]|nr:TlpA disulfide reductase family protein [Candidatus Omnitrophota bacterium]MDD5487684.1 TlpA disulfide reductase family protein [Candidatus Omnitrophota bacterium]
MFLRRNLTAFVLLPVLLFCSCARAGNEPVSPAGKGADFSLKALNGSEVRLSDKLGPGKKAVLVFFATWCPPCQREVPYVNDLNTRKGADIAVLGVNIQESPAKVSSFAESKKINYTVLLDADGEVANSYGVRSIPTIIALDGDMNILYEGHDIVDMEKKIKI